MPGEIIDTGTGDDQLAFFAIDMGERRRRRDDAVEADRIVVDGHGLCSLLHCGKVMPACRWINLD
jgi:hypothetical protein